MHATAPEASPWDSLVGPFLRSDGVRARLGISRQAVAAKAARRRLLRTITADSEHLYPLWQFDGDRLVDGLVEVSSLFAESSVDGSTLAAWLRTLDPDLGWVPTGNCAGCRRRIPTHVWRQQPARRPVDTG